MIPVRAAGVTSHRVRGVGVHDHHQFVVPSTGARVEIARWPRHPHMNSHVRVFDRHGALVAEEAHAGVIPVAALLRGHGFTLLDA